MAFSIQNDSASLRLHNSMQANARRIDNQMNHLSTGSRLNQAKDNPSAYAIYISMAAQTMAIDQSNRNTQTSNAMLQTAGGAVSSSVEVLSSLQEKLLQAANGTNNQGDLQNLQQEIDGLVATLDDNAGITFNGKNLLDGSQSGEKAMQVAGSDGMKYFSLGDMSAEGLGLTSGGKSQINLGTKEGIASALDLVSSALDQAVSEGAKIGATQQALGYRSDNYTATSANTTAASSTIGDTDMAKEYLNMQQNMMLQQTKLYMSTQANRSAYSVMNLLQ